MTVYVEYVLINNFIIDFCLLKATFDLTGLNVSRKRLVLCSIVGSVLALVNPLISNFAGLSFLIKCLGGFLIIALCAKFSTVRSYFTNTAVFFSYTFLTGGVIIGVSNMLNVDANSELFIAIMSIPVYFVLKVFGNIVKFIYRRKDIIGLTYKIEMKLGEKVVKCVGFLDTGNGVYDGNSPVIVCTKEFFTQFLGKDFYKLKFKGVYARTVNGCAENIAITLDEFKIYIWAKPNIYNNVTLMMVNGRVGEGYDVILHPALFENFSQIKESNDEDIIKIKKVS